MDRQINIYKLIAESGVDGMDCILKLYSNSPCLNEQKAGQLLLTAAHITASLSNKKSVIEGLLLLREIVTKCPTDILLDNGLAWIVLCIKSANNDELCVRNLSYLAIATLLRSISALPELHKTIPSSNITKLLQHITCEGTALSALYCLEQCLRGHPGSCGAFKGNIERFLFQFLNEQDLRKVKLSAKCMHLLHQVSGSGFKGATHKTAWEQQFRMIVGSLHTEMDLLYTNVMESTMKPQDCITLNLPPLDLSDNPIHHILKASTRFNNLCYMLQMMLTEPFPVPKRVHPDLVLHLITRGLGVTAKSLGTVSTDNLILKAFLPSIHLSLLRTLNALLFCLGRNILCHGRMICNMLNQTLKWTNTANSEGAPKAYRDLRIAAYDLLIRWLKIASLGSCVEFYVDDIVSNILSDIIPSSTNIKLSKQADNYEAMSKLAKRELNNSKEGKNKQNLHRLGVGENLCCAALRCLQMLLSSSSGYMKASMHKGLQTSIANLLLRLQIGQLTHSTFTNTECRLELYNVFLSLVLYPQSSFPAPIHLAVDIFSKGQMDIDSKIKQRCKDYLCSVKKIIFTSSTIKENKERATCEEKSQDIASHMIYQNGKVEDLEVNPENIEKIICEESDIEQSDIESSQNSQKTIILDTSDSFGKKENTNGTEFCEMLDAEPECHSTLNKLNEEISVPEDVITIADEVPMKRLKLSENNQHENASFAIVQSSSDTAELDNTLVVSDDTSMSNNHISSHLDAQVQCPKLSEVTLMDSDVQNIPVQNDLVSTNSIKISNIITPDEGKNCGLTVEEMLSSFVSEPNEVL